MKKYSYILIFLLNIHMDNVYCQSTSSGPTNTNTPFGLVDYLGWTAGVNRSLEINNQDAFPINLSTNNIQRMTIRGANNTPYVGLNNTGYVGIRTTVPGSPLTVFSDNTPGGQIIPGSNWSNGLMIRNH